MTRGVQAETPTPVRSRVLKKEPGFFGRVSGPGALEQGSDGPLRLLDVEVLEALGVLLVLGLRLEVDAELAAGLLAPADQDELGPLVVEELGRVGGDPLAVAE